MKTVNYISCLVACKIVFCSKFPNILDNAGKLMRRTRRRTQAIAKHYAFHTNAKNGKYTIQELIVLRKFIKTTLFGNCIENEQVKISGQKIDITYIWKKLLEKNEKFASKRSDEVFDNMDRESIIENLQKLSEVQSSGLNLETNYLRHRLKSLERTKHLMCWHDGSTVGGRRYIVVTISVMFDMAVFQ